MREPDLPGISGLPRVIRREEVAPYIQRIEELRERIEKNNEVAEAHRQLRSVVNLALKGLERYRDGANADELAQVLRDIASNANRRL